MNVNATTPAPLPNIPPGKRVHKTVSPSQVDTYKKCPRRWYNASVLYDREPSKGFQLKGDAIHKALEIYGQTGEVVPSVKMMNPLTKVEEEISTFAFVQAAIPHIAPPANDAYWDEWKGKGPGGTGAAGLMLEQQADMATWAAYDVPAPGGGTTNIIGPNWTQFIDRVEAYPDRARIIDFKTSSDFRYAKKPAELKENNTQLLSNARWLFQNSDYKEIEIGHLYLGTKTKTPKAFPVMVTVTREDVEKVWAEDLEKVKEMVTWAAMNPPTADPLPPNTSSCGDYGGCYYREKCGFDSKGASVTKIRPFGEKPPEVSPPLFPVTIPHHKIPQDGALSVTTETISQRSPMDTTATPANTAPKPGLLATLMAGKGSNASKPAGAPAPSTVAAAPAPSASPAPLVGLAAPKVVIAAPKPGGGLAGLLGKKTTPIGDVVAPAAPAVMGLVVPAAGPVVAPAPVKPSGLAGLLGKKAAPMAPPTPPAALEAAPGSISPPDAAPDTSTAEEVAAANPEPEPETKPEAEASPEPSSEGAAVAEGTPKRKGRPPGSKNKTAPAETALIAELSEARATQTPAAYIATEVATISAALAEAQVSSAEDAPVASPPIKTPEEQSVDAIREHFRTADPAFACGTRFLFVDCLPGKGWPSEAPVDLNDLMHAFQGTAASTAQALDYRLIRYESKAYLCMAIRVLMKGLPVSVHVNSNTPGAAEFLAEVTPYAEMIFRGTS